MSLLFVALLIQVAAPKPTEFRGPEAHPRIPCWTSEGGWAPPGELAITMFSTRNDEPPAQIEHGRDQVVAGEEVEQDYNYLDYHFANEGRALVARTYLDEPYKVAARFEGAALPRDAEIARQMIAGSVMCYLQKRFVTIEALTRDGYVQLWPEE